jgi:hypothetical protein
VNLFEQVMEIAEEMPDKLAAAAIRSKLDLSGTIVIEIR